MIYLKLHGIARSGTNYIRLMIERNFADATVLVNVLGWKHGFAWDPAEWLRFHRDGDLLHASYTQPHQDPPQHFPQSAKAIQAALDDGRVRYLITMRNPYAIIPSQCAFEGMEPNPELVYYKVCELNRRYRDWYDSLPNPTILVYEAMAADHEAVLDELRRLHDIAPAALFPQQVHHEALPSFDSMPITGSPWIRRRRTLLPELADIVRRHTAWDMFRWYDEDNPDPTTPLRTAVPFVWGYPSASP